MGTIYAAAKKHILQNRYALRRRQRDLEWLSANFAIGANFSRFNETNSGTPQILSALLGQIEFPKVSLPQLKMFSAFSLYTEFSLWFIPTDVSGTIGIKNLVPQISEGIRVNIF